MSGRIILIIGGLVVAAAIAAALLASQQQPQAQPTQDVAQPSFAAALPSDRPPEDIQWSQLNPPDSQAIFTYVDQLDDVTIKITQQPLPDKFRHDTEPKIARLATDYNAPNKLYVDDITVHIGDNSRGPQSVIFSKKDLLISITSEDKISDESWRQYIAALD